MNYYCDHNICPLTTDLPQQTDTVMVNHDIHFEQIAQVLNISVDELEDLNPQYRRDIVNGRSELAALRLPEALIPVLSTRKTLSSTPMSKITSLNARKWRLPEVVTTTR